MCTCSALAVLASGSGVSTERETFMDLVKTEITRLNGEVSNRGSMSMVFHHGGVHVSLLPHHPLAHPWHSLISAAHAPDADHLGWRVLV